MEMNMKMGEIKHKNNFQNDKLFWTCIASVCQRKQIFLS